MTILMHQLVLWSTALVVLVVGRLDRLGCVLFLCFVVTAAVGQYQMDVLAACNVVPMTACVDSSYIEPAYGGGWQTHATDEPTGE